MKKFEFTGEVNPQGLKRIRALVDLPKMGVKAGDLGGFLEKEDNLTHAGSCWVSINALIWGDACIEGNARIWGNACLWGNAHIMGNARIEGNTCIWGNARIEGDARIMGNARIEGDARIEGNARIWGDARIGGNARIEGNAHIGGNARIEGNAHIGGNARIVGNACIWGDARIGGNARIWGNARIEGDALISNTQDYLTISPVGSENGILTVFRSEKGLSVTRGCFEGTLEAFEEAVKTKHKGTQHETKYLSLLNYVKTHFGV